LVAVLSIECKIGVLSLSTINEMELSDAKLRQIVRETLRELGPQADPALVRKVVRDVVRQLEKKGVITAGATIHKLSVIESK
jgi:hypothetical protein